ncbi:MAG: hypothetical protein ACLUFN_07625 [Eubacterium sp.]
MPEFKVLRGKIKCKEKYCRIPIQRKRTVISQLDIDDLTKYQNGHGYSDTTMLLKAKDIAEMGDTYWAGKIYSYIDMKNGREYAFIERIEEQEGKQCD